MIIGMDPGVTGAIAVLTSKGELRRVEDMPVFSIKGKASIDVHALGLILSVYPGALTVIEQVGAMPGQGVSSMFGFGFSAGVLHGAVGALNMPLETVTPAKWKRHFRLGKDKDAARQAAIRRWPEHSALFSRKKDAGRAEACLIALYSLETAAISIKGRAA